MSSGTRGAGIWSRSRNGTLASTRMFTASTSWAAHHSRIRSRAS